MKWGLVLACYIVTEHVLSTPCLHFRMKQQAPTAQGPRVHVDMHAASSMWVIGCEHIMCNIRGVPAVPELGRLTTGRAAQASPAAQHP